VNKPAVYSQLTTDQVRCKAFADELCQLDAGKLEEVFLAIAKEENAVEIFRAIGKNLSPEDYGAMLNNVVAVWASQCSAGTNLAHLYPLIVEYQTNEFYLTRKSLKNQRTGGVR
jgi:hypothetical protein